MEFDMNMKMGLLRRVQQEDAMTTFVKISHAESYCRRCDSPMKLRVHLH